MTSRTLAQAIEHDSIDMEQLTRDHRPMLLMVKELIGVVPNCDHFLEIWPTGFRTYNLLVPNLLNLPASIFGTSTAKDLVGLAMYTASRAAECMYCSAHTCSFALRRGTTPQALTGDYTPVEAAVAAVAEGMSSMPPTVTPADVENLRQHLDEGDIEWIALSAAMMGFLNKFMDTMGIELEESAIEDVSDLISDTGWSAGKHAWSSEEIDEFTYQIDGQTLSSAMALGSPLGASSSADDGGQSDSAGHKAVPRDSIGTYLRVLRQAPSALRRDRAWTKGMSAKTGEALLTLEDELGLATETLSDLSHGRAVRAIATVLRDNMDSATTTVGLDVKCLVALVYARSVGNDVLAAEAIEMAKRVAPDLSQRKLAAIGRFASGEAMTTAVPPGLSKIESAAVMLARAAAPSPSEVNEITIAVAADHLSPAQIVETVVWISIQQVLHRLQVFYAAADPEADWRVGEAVAAVPQTNAAPHRAEGHKADVAARLDEPPGDIILSMP